ncbi:sulfate adenylyltransferase subunit CysN [Aestuariirhabdus litorea]|uniref:Sulfate adenylyltransferase subunit 1 n=1 Tax=Aestuariirhabdus litorea TaxID=2528527 RepID=A0A3P3VP97_9GAMM|nr:sulfate adenylyltransferase subunit CysN [Aestuariirhabdus litorea]RRJ83738.1 sulfate adenylyltransferase subunit CysN [Aestuariirhabdus litorea]RWW96961.1 sulfate adenylyltransferase subunit CysN [Endozoicomonadaceae bacterium GTF-13]
MSHQSDLIATDINEYLAQHERKELLHLLTCGSVDDGKSTLIGRLLHDSKMIYEDQLEAVRADTVKHGTTGGKLDLALLVDGLQAEREQGITIDVAYRYFSTARRKFIIADTPGHEQYTRNMATGASTCELAIILIDARHGVMTQTRRHSFIASLLGIRHVVVAINKMDLMDFSEQVYNDIREQYLTFADQLGIEDLRFIPISALEGDNVVNRSEKSPWYTGPSLMEILETVELSGDRNMENFRFPVQYVNRPNLNYRGFCGTVASGVVAPGDEVVALPSGKRSRVKTIDTYDGTLQEAFASQAVTITLEDEIDVSRGDMLVKSDDLPLSANHFEATLVWMSEGALKCGRQYDFKFSSNLTTGAVTDILYNIDVNTLEHKGAEQLQLNEIARCRVSVNKHVAFDPYHKSRTTGAFIVIDRLTNVTVGAGMINGIGSEERNHQPVSASERSLRLDQKPALIELVGEQIEERLVTLERGLFERGKTVLLLPQDAELNAAMVNALGNAGLVVLAPVSTPRTADALLSRAIDSERSVDEALEEILALTSR